MNVRFVFQQFEYLESRRYKGDLTASDTLMDLQRAIDATELTDRQRIYLHKFYVLGMTGADIAKEYGIGRNGVSNVIRKAERKIQTIIDGWGGGNV